MPRHATPEVDTDSAWMTNVGPWMATGGARRAIGSVIGRRRVAVRTQSTARFLCSLALALWLGGCAGSIAQRGNLPDPERLQQIEIGRHGRGEVAEILGSPSTIGAFSDKRWYYISRRTSRLAFLKPEILDQRVVVVDFDDEGTVRSIRELTADDRREIDLVDRKTPTAGQSITVVQQILGNVGRFNKPPGK